MTLASVVLVHGIRTSATMWAGIRERLDAAGIETVAVDLPGHGRRMDEPFTLAAAEATLEAAATGFEGPVVPVGLSLGGYLALRWACRTETPVAGVLAASCSVRPRGLPLAGYVALARAIDRLPDRGMALHMLTTRAALGERAAADVCAGGVALDAMVPTLRAMAQVDPWADLARLTVPVWLVNGSRDHFRIEERSFARMAPCSRRIRVRRAGHVLTADQPGQIARLIRTLVRSVGT